jgi:Flp pilus assembly secretin CpaC
MAVSKNFLSNPLCLKFSGEETSFLQAIQNKISAHTKNTIETIVNGFVV